MNAPANEALSSRSTHAPQEVSAQNRPEDPLDDVDLDAFLDSFDGSDFSTVFTESGVPGVVFTTPYEICLRPFLEALGWDGEDRQIVEAFPYKEPIDDLDTFRAVISRLGFTSRTYKISLSQVGTDHLPALAVLESEKPVVLLATEQRDLALLFDPDKFDFREIALDETEMICCVAEPAHDHLRPLIETKKQSWFSSAVYNLRKPLAAILGMTLAANLLALATPIYVMQIYNIVIGSKNPETLAFLFASVVLVVVLEIHLRRKRGRLMAYFGARLSSGVMNAGFSRLLSLPVQMIEAAPIGTQITRLKQFEGTHAVFTGPIGSAFLDFPFVLLFFATIAIISPLLATVPIALALIFAVLALLAVSGARRRNSDLSTAVAASNSFLTDALSKRSSIQELRMEEDWQRRFIGISRELGHKRYRVQFYDSMLGAIAQSMMMLAGVAALLIGTILVMSDALSVGGLVAIMMLIWRVLAPIQTVFSNLNRVSQFIESVKQVDVLMQIPVERVKNAIEPIHRRFRGRISFANVSFRYSSQQEPVFRGLTFDVPPGQFVCISGTSAGGKSTILKLVLGLYKPQAGTVFLDGLNLQQLDPAEVRASLAYVPLEPRLFHGTISQNMRLGAPTATDDEIEQALKDAGLDMSSSMFPEGCETRLTAQQLTTLPVGTLQRLSLARAYCRRAPAYLLNDPTANLDDDGERSLARWLAKMKGKATIILISSRPEHQRICDRVLKISNGSIAEDYAPSLSASEGVLQ
ncbi:MAG: ABC transporter transmembrane domain-containing protein [Pseudomonadota bacterium]